MAQLTSKPMEEAEAMAKAINDALEASDPRFRGTVVLSLEDGSFFLWESSFYEIHETDRGKWIMVFAEHYRPQVFAWDDVTSVRGLGAP